MILQNQMWRIAQCDEKKCKCGYNMNVNNVDAVEVNFNLKVSSDFVEMQDMLRIQMKSKFSI